ncbi:hypothetical protein [Catenulispora subtropica]|uniref:Uncharacterized protein n=1 Tax=Catenulispora subtropica TaxID=450798 RepID=A0ABN2QY37_9ACTN
MDTFAEESPSTTRMLRAGAALAGAGMMVAAVGMALTAVAVARSLRTWTKQHDISPTALAAARLEQARHASIAGLHAWHEHAPALVDGHRGER